MTALLPNHQSRIRMSRVEVFRPQQRGLSCYLLLLRWHDPSSFVIGRKWTSAVQSRFLQRAETQHSSPATTNIPYSYRSFFDISKYDETKQRFDGCETGAQQRGVKAIHGDFQLGASSTQFALQMFFFILLILLATYRSCIIQMNYTTRSHWKNLAGTYMLVTRPCTSVETPRVKQNTKFWF